jgi:TolA-binding protein
MDKFAMKPKMSLAVVAVSVLLLVSLTANGYLYFSENNDLSEQTTELQNQVSSLGSQTQNLQDQIGALQNQSDTNNNTIAALNSQIVSLQQENEALQKENENLTASIHSLQNEVKVWMPYLVTRLGAIFDYGYGIARSSIYIQGFVTNEGNATAYNCDLKIASQTTNGASYTDYYRFGTLAPGDYVRLDTHFYHEGIKNWTIIPECTSTP